MPFYILSMFPSHISQETSRNSHDISLHSHSDHSFSGLGEGKGGADGAEGDAAGGAADGADGGDGGDGGRGAGLRSTGEPVGQSAPE
jgi:hypothetical protein